jgi:hypothetical protein
MSTAKVLEKMGYVEGRLMILSSSSIECSRINEDNSEVYLSMQSINNQAIIHSNHNPINLVYPSKTNSKFILQIQIPYNR